MGLGVGSLAVAFGWSAGWLGPRELSPQAIVDRQQGGRQAAWPGFRRAHAKGVCVEGVFVSSGGLAHLSTARVFRPGEPTRLLGRFSVGGGNPTAPDLEAPVRSLALEFRSADGQVWRSAMNTPPVLAVKDPAGFHAQLLALRPDPSTGKPDPTAVAAFWTAHPESAAFRAWQKTYSPTGSFALERYHSINAFVLDGPGGVRTPVRWAAVPLTDAGAQPSSSGPDALQLDLSRRLEAGPVRFRLVFILAAPSDDPSDPSTPWPAGRPVVDAGLVLLTSASRQAGGMCEGVNYDPLVLPRGISPSNDPILHARSAAYAESYRRRAREQVMAR